MFATIAPAAAPLYTQFQPRAWSPCLDYEALSHPTDPSKIIFLQAAFPDLPALQQILTHKYFLLNSWLRCDSTFGGLTFDASIWLDPCSPTGLTPTWNVGLERTKKYIGQSVKEVENRLKSSCDLEMLNLKR